MSKQNNNNNKKRAGGYSSVVKLLSKYLQDLNHNTGKKEGGSGAVFVGEGSRENSKVSNRQYKLTYPEFGLCL